jgi:hypothetical protein
MARLLPEVPVPPLSGLTYSVDEFLLLLVLATGAGMGAKRKFPLWSYTWVVMAIGSMTTFFTACVSTIWLDLIDSGPVAWGWLLTSTHLAGGLFTLGFGASRARLGLTHAFFVAAIYLAANVASPFILEVSTDVALFQAAAANTVAVLIAVIMLAVIVSMVMQFLYGDEGTQRKSVYVLIAVALLAPVLTGWALALGSAGTGVLVLNVAGIFLGLQVLARWVYVGVVLLLTWVLIILFIRLRKSKVTNPPDSGEVHAG